MLKQFSFKEFQFSSPIIRDFVSETSAIKPYCGAFFSLENCLEQTKRKDFKLEDRKVLVEALKRQYSQTIITDETHKNISSLLDENTYTITTGHQLNLMTGPLYSLYKILQVITISAKLNQKGQQHFVPIFWMATEDHDFEEINHLHLYNQKISWDKEGQENLITGAILLDAIEEFHETISGKFNDERTTEQLKAFLSHYESGNNLASATRGLVNQLFGQYGLVIIDGNDEQLKQKFKSIAYAEIENQVTYKAVSRTNRLLEESGYHQQVYLRNINLFYIDDKKKRTRIALQDDQFSIGDESIEKTELLKLLESQPASFSPNALLRPVYQEAVLPNIAYIGGGGEIAYWMQIKGVFEALEIPYPLLRVRDSFVLLNDKQVEDMNELGLSLTDLKRDYHELIKEIALEEVSIDIELDREKAALKEIEAQLNDKVEHINKGLLSMVGAEFTKMEKSLERIESKMIKAEKSRHEQKGKKIQKLQDKIYPKGGFQERYENFLMYYFKEEDFINRLCLEMVKSENEPYIRVLNA